MHIKLPYSYAIHGRRGKLGRTVHAAGVVERDVPEISSQMAPVVAEWIVDDGPQNPGAIWGGSRYSRTFCRSFDGAHYIPLPGPLKADMFAQDRLFCSGLCVQSLLKLMNMRPGQPDTRILEKLYIGERPAIGNFGKPVDRVVTSDETYRRLAATALVNSLLFIDGVAWTCCNEPKLRATRTVNGGEVRISVDTEFDNDVHKRGYGPHVRAAVHDTDLFFNLADLDDAKTVLASRGIGRRQTLGSIESVSIHSPDHFAFDGHRARLRAIARDLVGLLRNRVGEMDAAVAQDWVSLREAAERISAVDTDKLNEMISRLLPELDGNGDAIRLGDELALAQYIKDLKGVVQLSDEVRRHVSIGPTTIPLADNSTYRPEGGLPGACSSSCLGMSAPFLPDDGARTRPASIIARNASMALPFVKGTFPLMKSRTLFSASFCDGIDSSGSLLWKFSVGRGPKSNAAKTENGRAMAAVRDRFRKAHAELWGGKLDVVNHAETLNGSDRVASISISWNPPPSTCAGRP